MNREALHESRLGVASQGPVVGTTRGRYAPAADPEDVTRGDGSLVLHNEEGAVGMAWRVVLLVLPFLGAAYLLRYIPIRLQTSILADRGVPTATALAQARYAILDDPTWSALVGIAQGLVWFPLVSLIITMVERRPCSMRDLGLATGPRGLLLVLTGIVLAAALYVGYGCVDSLLHSTRISWTLSGLHPITAALTALNFIANAYGEETAFRAYLQDRLVGRHGLWYGVALTSVGFVLLHLFVSRISGLALLASVMISAVYGILYLQTQSVYLVGTMHAVFNIAPRLLHQWPTDESLLIVHALALFVAIVWFIRRNTLRDRNYD